MAMDFTAMQDMIGRAQDAIEDLFPGVVVIDGVEYACALGSRLARGKLDDEHGGMDDDAGYVLRVKKSLITEAELVAQDGQRVTVDDVVYRLVGWTAATYDTAWRLELTNVR